MRPDAMTLLGDMGPNPTINMALREMLEAEDVPSRIAAYEALVQRGDAAVRRRPVDGKFLLDEVTCETPLIYVVQSGEPRIAIFGADLKIDRPALIFAWSDRLILASDSPTDPLRLMYKDYRTNNVTRATIDDRVARIVEYFARTDTPETPGAGIGLTYSEVVGALYELTERRNAIAATFIGEQDRLQAEVLAAAETSVGADRPELSDTDAPPPTALAPERPEAAPVAASPAASEESVETAAPKRDRPSYVVPIPPSAGSGKKPSDAGKPSDGR
jgi:hypothetical protein